MFVAFEGIDGSGKTTQAIYLGKYLISKHIPMWGTSEPYDEKLRELIFNYYNLDPVAEYLLFAADRAQHQVNIRAHLSKGDVVISDRYLGSSIAYQGIKGVSTDFMRDVFEGSLCRVPDLTFWIDTDPAECKRRIEKRGVMNRFDHTDLNKLHERYSFQSSMQSNWHTIDGNRSEAEIANEIAVLFSYLSKGRLNK